MSKKTDKLEQEIEELGRDNIGKPIPEKITDWMINEGILAGSIIESAERLGQENSKTDVLIRLKESQAIKISAKLANADYFGNWYGHERIINEFGIETFELLSRKVTEWANEWIKKPQAELFVGVSVSFGARSGETSVDFCDIFKSEDVLKIAKGVGTGDNVANALFVSNKCPSNIEDLFDNLQEINRDNIEKAVKDFKVIYRPINPMTDDSDRCKCVYTMFKPYKRQETEIVVDSVEKLRELGEFVEIDWTKSYKMNHNRVLDMLKTCYNISISRYGKEIPKTPKTKDDEA
ncbi:MAG: hypothetical protein K5669_10010 [Lachnospiraceae bacterium]|nr:hypothetical protein [Lachnospiraceae bacterium]